MSGNKGLLKIYQTKRDDVKSFFLIKAKNEKFF